MKIAQKAVEVAQIIAVNTAQTFSGKTQINGQCDMRMGWRI